MSCYDVLFSLPPCKPIMALDLGKKYIGIAFSDDKKRFAIPHSMFLRDRHSDMERLNILYEKYSACLLVVGMPYDHVRDDGWVESIERFSAGIKNKYGMPIYFQDESFTTCGALMLLAGKTKKNKKKSVDKLSACCILECTLDIIKVV